MPTSVKRKIIIDTDCGSDDAIGIMTALTDPNTEVLAITAVWGNVNVDQGVKNLGKLLDVFERDIPIYKGAKAPLVGEPETVTWGGFGKDGFGDADYPESNRIEAIPKTHAALAIVDLLNNTELEQGEVMQLVCLGPLTNVALAIRLDPDAFHRLGDDTNPAITFMGGCSEAKGNSGMAAEFNVHSDPEAAHVVFNNRGMKPVLMASWELTVSCCMTWSFYDQWVGRGSGAPRNKYRVFIEKIFQRLEAFSRPLEDGTKADTGDDAVTQDVTCVIPDAVGMLVALHPEAVLDSFLTYSTVELHGRETRGATCFDWYGTEQSMAKKGRWHNLCLITRASNEKFLEVMNRIVEYGE